MKTNINEIIKDIKQKLVSCSPTSHEAEQQAWWMLQEITKKSEPELLLQENIQITKEQEKKLNEWIDQRLNEQKPIQYIFGHTPFLNLDIIVKPPILIPRPETEEIVSWLINKLENVKNEKLNILDLGTGSGCIALALAKAFSNSNVVGTDINLKALELAQENAKHNNIKNVSFIESNFYSNVSKNLKFDLIISNPPYISDKEWDNLPQNVSLWEDYKALVANNKGFACYEKIISAARGYLNEKSILYKKNLPQMVLEIGKDQERGVNKLLEKSQFKNVHIYPDLSGINRWITVTF